MSSSIHTIWTITDVSFSFDAVVAGPLFYADQHMLVIGGLDGDIRVCAVPNAGTCKWSDVHDVRVLESKGSAIRCMLRDTDTGDLLSGDARGNICLFADWKIRYRRQLTQAAITACSALSCNGDGVSMIGDSAGMLMAVSLPYNRDIIYSHSVASYELSTVIEAPTMTLSAVFRGGMSAPPEVTSILPVELPDSYGLPIHLLLVCDTAGRMHVFQREIRLFTWQMPCRINTICCGRFDSITSFDSISGDDNHISKSNNTTTVEKTQVAVGGDDGNIYIVDVLNNGTTKVLAHIGFTITHMKTVVHDNSDDNNLDGILCGGEFTSLRLLRHGDVVATIKLSDWVVDMDVRPVVEEAIDGMTTATCVTTALADGVICEHRVIL